MGLSLWGSILLLSLFMEHLMSQNPNTDGFFLSDFLRKMGLSNSSQVYSFSSSSSFCFWRGVVCDSRREHVIEFVASGLGLSGSIPDNTVGKLRELQSLDLSNNKITSLPSDFWSLGSLKSLNLSSNQISGSLPSNIGNFGLLETLDLSFNNVSGEIPAALSSLVGLRVLKLNNNGFRLGIPPAILTCRSLASIDLSSNQLNGSLPVGFGSAFPELRSLNLAGNQIRGSDMDFSGMNSIVSLIISGNLFQGSVMGVSHEKMEVIDLSRNQFDGHISQVISNHNHNWSNLVYLDLSENRFVGHISLGLSSAQKLRHLNLAYNRFRGQEFPRIEMLSSLEHLNLSWTNLTSAIPREILRLTHLKTLDLSSNHLTGHIPLLSLANLQVLDLSNNNLDGEIPVPLLEKLHLMERFNFSHNNVTFCASEFSQGMLQSSFFGSTNNCPIAANPIVLKRRKVMRNTGLKLALVLTISVTFFLVGLLLFLAFGCRKKSKTWATKQTSYREEQNVSGPFSFQTDSTTWMADVKQATQIPVVIFDKPLWNITFADLLVATLNFDRGALLSEGKFGHSYRAILHGGVDVALKVLAHGSMLTDQEAASEFEYLGRIQHPNIVPISGYCIAGEQRIAIYELMEKGNLHNWLHNHQPQEVQRTEDWSTEIRETGIQNDVASEGMLETWRIRHKIALGTARALAFLHHGCIPPMIHGNVRACTVCLDSNLEPRLSDFGLSRLFGSSLDEGIGGGSEGYMPPEFQQQEHASLTAKSDVYCFGVVLFELLTGKRPVGDDYEDEKEGNLVSWVRRLVRERRGSRAIDPKMQNTGPLDQMMEAVKIGYLCTAEWPSKRPSMQQIVGLLKDVRPNS